MAASSRHRGFEVDRDSVIVSFYLAVVIGGWLFGLWLWTLEG